MDNKKNINISLDANSFSFKNLKIPLFISLACLILGFLFINYVQILTHKLSKDSVIVLLSLIGILFFFLKYKYIYDAYLEIDENEILSLKKKNNKLIFSSPLKDLSVEIGYFRVSYRFGSGYSAVIQINTNNKKSIVIGCMDFNNYYYWGEDSLKTNIFSNPTDFSSPQYLVSGRSFMFLAQTLVDEPKLTQVINGL